ncbi:hypothetical protein J3B02_004286 [Coemansia erecta]|uniref:Uncharacterized protein n=1 Tax=Coemansia asiatica TaxID=1052880 RepID=A0A9W8CGZ9_9FUNG|nr:hypothetical protein LPJ64_004786 [Coemansia asiatica]KAJ2846920.1 hypothetical protein J3B02_004286 [Coemansia erecta]
MKFIETIGIFAVLSASAFAGKCGVQQPPVPEYTTLSTIEAVSPTTSVLDYTTSSSSSSSSSVEIVPTSSAPEYTASSSSSTYYSSLSQLSTTYPAEYYTTIENPFSTYLVSPDNGSSSSSPSSPSSSSSTTYPAEYYTTIENPFSTYQVISSTAAAAPSETPSSSAYQLTLEQLNAAVPDRAGADSCSSAEFPDECATNEQALPAINAALTKYGITKRSEVVAVISLMAYESSSWLYNINHWPGRAGQGTRNMQMTNFNQEYASFLHPEQASSILASASNSASDETVNALRALVLNDNDSFGSGFWYLVNKAAAYHDTGKIADNSADAFKDYVVSGVGAGWDDARQTVWQTVNSGISA